jgi:hypothetical protein
MKYKLASLALIRVHWRLKNSVGLFLTANSRQDTRIRSLRFSFDAEICSRALSGPDQAQRVQTQARFAEMSLQQG